MNWLANLIPPRIRSFVGEQKEVPDNLWQKCPGCEAMLFHRDLAANQNVCYYCGHHLRMDVKDRLALMYDDGKYHEVSLPHVAYDPLKFKDRKRYTDRIKEAQTKTGLKEAISVVCGTMGGLPVVVAAFNFNYMGGSMGAAVGEAIVKAAQLAVEKKAALIAIPASGGARMQEGMLSLIQMPRTIAAIQMVKEARLPYIVILTDPTTGGVSASFAMIGDIHIAEPGAMIGFAGRRVIEETVRETLPDNFQTAEYLLEHGMVDMVVSRKDIKNTLVNIIGILMNKSIAPDPDNGGKKSHEKDSNAVRKAGIIGKRKHAHGRNDAAQGSLLDAPSSAVVVDLHGNIDVAETKEMSVISSEEGEISGGTVVPFDDLQETAAGRSAHSKSKAKDAVSKKTSSSSDSDELSSSLSVQEADKIAASG